jgi:hypothetical protein
LWIVGSHRRRQLAVSTDPEEAGILTLFFFPVHCNM